MFLTKSERANGNTSCGTLIPSFRGLRKERWDHDHPFSDKERKPELQINQGLIN